MLKLFRVDYLDKKALENLKNYKYQSGSYSILDHVLNPMWIRVTELFPMWLAPNAITVSGLIG